MTTQQIEKFIDAGYTKEEINLLFKDPKIDPEPEPEPEPEDKKKPQPEPENKAQPQPDPEQNNSHEQFAQAFKSLTDIVAGLQETVKALQENNIKNAGTDNSKKDTIQDVMQSFIDQL